MNRRHKVHGLMLSFRPGRRPAVGREWTSRDGPRRAGERWKSATLHDMCSILTVSILFFFPRMCRDCCQPTRQPQCDVHCQNQDSLPLLATKFCCYLTIMSLSFIFTRINRHPNLVVSEKQIHSLRVLLYVRAAYKLGRTTSDSCPASAADAISGWKAVL